MKKANSGSRLGTVMVLLIFCFFAISALITLALGGSIYKGTVELTGEKYNEQTGLSYIWTKVKTSDVLGGVYVSEFDGISALCIEEEFDGITYITMIYHYDGWVRELFFESGLNFMPGDGAPIIEGSSLMLESLSGGLIRASSGGESVLLSLRTKADERSRQD